LIQSAPIKRARWWDITVEIVRLKVQYRFFYCSDK